MELVVIWNQIIRGKYGKEHGGHCTKDLQVGYRVGVWKLIRKEWNFVAAKFPL